MWIRHASLQGSRGPPTPTPTPGLLFPALSLSGSAVADGVCAFSYLLSGFLRDGVCACVCVGWVVSIFAASKIHHFQINKEGSPATFSIKMDSGRVVSHASVDALIEYFCADSNAG